MERGRLATLIVGNSGTSRKNPWRMASLSSLRTTTKYCDTVVELKWASVKRLTNASIIMGVT